LADLVGGIFGGAHGTHGGHGSIGMGERAGRVGGGVGGMATKSTKGFWLRRRVRCAYRREGGFVCTRRMRRTLSWDGRGNTCGRSGQPLSRSPGPDFGRLGFADRSRREEARRMTGLRPSRASAIQRAKSQSSATPLLKRSPTEGSSPPGNESPGRSRSSRERAPSSKPPTQLSQPKNSCHFETTTARTDRRKGRISANAREAAASGSGKRP